MAEIDRGAFNTREMREHAEAAFAPFRHEVEQSRNGVALMTQHRRPTTASTWPATEKQLDFLRKLQGEKVISDELALDIAFELEQPSGPTKTGVSGLIDDLLKAPRAVAAVAPAHVAAAPDVPAGRYAIEDRMGVLRFVRVDRPTEGRWKGMTFVKLQVSDDFVPMKGDQRILALTKIAEDPQAASKRYGHEIGACGVCGRTLTDEHSRELGIGPVCIAKMGW